MMETKKTITFDDIQTMFPGAHAAWLDGNETSRPDRILVESTTNTLIFEFDSYCGLGSMNFEWYPAENMWEAVDLD